MRLFEPVSPSPAGQKANELPLALIEDRIRLLGCFLLSDPQRVVNLHQKDGLSVRQLVARLGVSHSSVLVTVGKLGIVCKGPRNAHAVRGQVPFGWNFQDARLVKNDAELQVIHLIRLLQESGESLPAVLRRGMMT